MPKSNPTRAAQGGAVPGFEKIDMTGAVPSDALEVATCSFDPGYDIDVTLEAGYVSKADMKRGYSSYGEGVGEAKKNWKAIR